jgi:hypothetical protein
MGRDALIVGINRYDHLPGLTAPAIDAQAIAQRLSQDGEFRVTRSPEAVKDGALTVGQTLPVTQTQLEEALIQLFLPKGKPPNTALFYFSGHGLRKERGISEGFLATSDVNPSLGQWGLSLKWLREILQASPIRQQVIWLDCSYSGGLVNLSEGNPGERGAVCDRNFIASSREYEVSYQDIRSPHSVLTNALLKGLDPSRSQGRWLTNLALVDFLHQELQSETQQPIFTNFGEAINLTRRGQIASREIVVETVTEICPYKGLRYFDCNAEDPKYFFGREALTDHLIDHVRQHNFLAILGASGSGKSSVLRAGLLHQLQLGQKLGNSEQWAVYLLLPSEHPLDSLALALVNPHVSDLDRAEQLGRAKRLIAEGAQGLANFVQASNEPRVLIGVDQFEEVFTLCQDPFERQQFIHTLLGALAQSDKLGLIIGMRADFLGKCVEQDYGGLANQIQQHLIAVTPLSQEQLEDAICKPARSVDLAIEPELVMALLKDVADSPGSLPLLQYTLEQLWQQGDKRHLRLKTYIEAGGVSGTLDRRATAVYEQFKPEQQAAAQHIFLSLTQLGEGTEDTRKRVLMQDLITAHFPAAVVEPVVQRLADEKLVVTSQLGDSATAAVVDVAHEALIRYWSLLRQWLDSDRDGLRRKRRIEAAAEEWRDRGKAKDYLLMGKPLKEARAFQEGQGERLALSELAAAFIEKSGKQQRTNQFKLIGLGLVVPLGLAIWLGIIVERPIRIRQLWQTVG